MRALYLAAYGDKLKVGTTYDLVGRMRQHAYAARQAGLSFAPLFSLPAHGESEENELAVLAKFGTPGTRSEYLDADPDEVIGYMQTLPFTPTALPERVHESEQWLDRAQVAKVLGMSPQTVDRYARSGHLPPYKNTITKRVRFRVEDVRALA